MTTGLLLIVLFTALAALAAATFGPWSAISSSALASWWRKRPSNLEKQTTRPE